MKKRLFIALGVSGAFSERILTWQKSFKRVPARWIEPNNLHITLVPPWYSNNWQKVIPALTQTARAIQPFQLTFTAISIGPNGRNPKLIWVTGNAHPGLLLLRKTLLIHLGFKEETRPFVPHITIGRFPAKDRTQIPVGTIGTRILWKESFDSFVLMESKLLQRGAEYTLLYQQRLTEKS